MRFFLVRHGESRGNRDQLVTGGPDDPLTALGQNQAQALRQMFSQREKGFDGYFTSPLLRAIQTAKILEPEARFVVVPELAETDAGLCKEWRVSEFNKRFPEFWGNFSAARHYPEGESHAEMYDRVWRWMSETIRKFGEDSEILVVGHGGSISSMLHWCFEISLENFPRFPARNGTLTIVRLSGDCEKPVSFLEGFNLR